MRILRTILAILAAAGTGIQSWLLLTTGEAYCLNDGCSVVEKLISIPPQLFDLSIPPTLWFYALGTLIFFTIFIASAVAWLADSEEAEKTVGYLLTAAMAAEGVLIFFQHAIAQSWCYSCLSVFSCLLLLTLLSGMEQIVRGILAFCAVLIASFALQWGSGGSGLSLRAGTMAGWAEKGNETTITLIFSETCPHCEKVIDFLREESRCNINFNPIEKRIKAFDFPGAKFKSYAPQANISFMRSIGMGSVPILLVPARQGATYEILKGTNQILPWVEKNCRLHDELGDMAPAAAAQSITAPQQSSGLPAAVSPATKSEIVLPGGAAQDNDQCHAGVAGC